MSRYPRQPLTTGAVFGELTVLEEMAAGPSHNRRVRCRCTCGAEKIAFVSNLKLGRTRSCGCTYVFGAAGRAAILADRRARAQETDDGRMCHTCQTWKTWNNFRPDPRRPRGMGPNCIECGRWRRIRLVYGIARADWESIQASQGGSCGLCGETRDLTVDHDHSCCGVNRGCRECIRGLLCDFCNRVLGRIEQKPELAGRFADYLNRRPLRQ